MVQILVKLKNSTFFPLPYYKTIESYISMCSFKLYLLLKQADFILSYLSVWYSIVKFMKLVILKRQTVSAQKLLKVNKKYTNFNRSPPSEVEKL